MNTVEFRRLNAINQKELLAVLNEDKLRMHLIDHAYFDDNSLKHWVEAKLIVDSLPGCRVRAVCIDGKIAGWCGIQPDDHGYELAIVLSQKFWGLGISLFKVLMRWANELKHKEVLFHLLDTRPDYKVLSKIASRVIKTYQLGRSFNTYFIDVRRSLMDSI
ncbi:N-acetyltransferase [Microbulbifer sp. MLAF003]|uniref:GNAT family N-acetyltransferase n=1 Tax=unclassified Microbulbifer TaxID=2619833 RepID=UPI0024AD03F4|nr:GNAT family N-acetyltransferase [Microbulbifer sp. MLAF003]WHI49670.1 N-acetyltransferase [Microbulbifer sp. MLAF003]